MSSMKCPHCGLINFATAEACKRCKQAFEADPVDLAYYGNRSHTVGNIIFAIYLGLHVTVLPFALLALSWLMSHDGWGSLTNEGTRFYLPSFAPLCYLTLVGILIYLPASVILMVRLFQKSQAFLTWVVIYLLGEFVYSLIQGALMWSVSGEMTGKQIPQFDIAASQMLAGIGTCVISILITFIWFRYYTSSRHARAVFAS